MPPSFSDNVGVPVTFTAELIVSVNAIVLPTTLSPAAAEVATAVIMGPVNAAMLALAADDAALTLAALSVAVAVRV